MIDRQSRAVRGAMRSVLAEGRMRVILLQWLVFLLLLLGGGALSDAAAKARGDAKSQRPARDSVLMIPRVSRAPTLDRALDAIRTAQREARQSKTASRPRWPVIVLRSPKGWTGPKELDGHKLEGYWRSHQVPFADARPVSYTHLTLPTIYSV